MARAGGGGGGRRGVTAQMTPALPLRSPTHEQCGSGKRGFFVLERGGAFYIARGHVAPHSPKDYPQCQSSYRLMSGRGQLSPPPPPPPPRPM